MGALAQKREREKITFVIRCRSKFLTISQFPAVLLTNKLQP